MKVTASFGTPSHLEPHVYTSPSLAKGFLSGKMVDREHWAERYNGEVKRRLVAAREELDGLDLQKIAVGDVRQWEIIDDVSGTRFVYRIEKTEE